MKDQFAYVHNDEVDNGVFDIIRMPNGECLYSFKDKHSIFNVFPNLGEYLNYVRGEPCARECIEDDMLDESDPDYEEGVDALDRYLRSLV